MSGYGFVNLRIRAEDGSVPPAEILFRPGLNVIAGDSNTGKSYLRQCFDFMFGSGTHPKNIDEAKPYQRLFLEIQDREGSVYTLERSLLGGEFRVYERPFSEIKGTTARILTTKVNETASAFFLNLCGTGNAKIRVNAQSKTESVTFRTMSHLFVVDETTIISESSPINQPVAQRYTNTKAKALFNFFLTGKDDSSLIPVPDQKIAKAQQAAKKEVYDQLIADLESKINEHGQQTFNVQEEINRLKRRVEVVSSEINSSNSAILEQQQRRQENWKSQKEKSLELL